MKNYQEEISEGITLKTISYGERKRICTVFSEQNGIISLITNSLSCQRGHLLAITTPFSIAEFVYKKTRSDFFYLIDGHTIDEQLFLKENLNALNSAATLATVLLQSQLPQRKSPLLYVLVKKYFQKAPFIPSDTLLTSFKLKIMLHEGVIDIKKKCNVCKSELAHYIKGGESLCLNHTSHPSLFFSSSEKDVLQNMAALKNFSKLNDLKLSKHFVQNIDLLFEELCGRGDSNPHKISPTTTSK